MALHDEDERRDVTYEEARAVLEAQRETMAGVDTKAVRTVRITVILLGILLSAWRVDSGLFDPLFGGAGGFALVGSLAAGIATYSESDLRLGPSKAYVEQLSDGAFDEYDWERDLLHSFGDWIASNERELWVCSQLLSVSQVLLLTGVVLIALSVLL